MDFCDNFNFKEYLYTGSIAQVVECLPCKHEALCSNTSTTKNIALKNLKLISFIPVSTVKVHKFDIVFDQHQMPEDVY
jgi:hypothetical protein